MYSKCRGRTCSISITREFIKIAKCRPPYYRGIKSISLGMGFTNLQLSKSKSLVLNSVAHWSYLKCFFKYHCLCSTSRNSDSIGMRGIVDCSQRRLSQSPMPLWRTICHSTYQEAEFISSPLKSRLHDVACFVQ